MIHVVARSKEVGNAFVKSHSAFGSEIVVELGQRSYFGLLNRIIKEGNEDYACVVHDDVYLCSDFNEKVRALVKTLNREWPNWGLAGNAGLIPMRVGYGATEVVRYLADPHGGPNLAGHILPAMSIDGNVMLLNTRAMRERSVQLPDFDGFQLYDIVLSIETISGGLGVFVAPSLACWHGSKGNQQDFDQAKDTVAFHSYLAKRVKNRHFRTLNGSIQVPLPGKVFSAPKGIDAELDSLRTACRERPVKKVAIVTRSQFQRPELLDRCLNTIAAFIASAGDATEFRSYVVTDSDAPAPDWIRSSTVLRATIEDGGDTRYKLVRFAAEKIDADFFWFIDDDDWILPNEAERLGLLICSAPRNSVLFVDCEQFNEKPFPVGTADDVASYRSVSRSYFLAQRFLFSLSGENHSPFCGVIFGRDALLSIPPRVYDTVTYYEDFMTTLNTLLTRDALPVVVSKLYVGISIRENGNTVTEIDRSKWNKSMSEMVSHLVNTATSSQMLSLPSHAIRVTSYEAELAHVRGQLGERQQILDIIARSRSWRLTRPLRGVARLLRGQLHMRDPI